MFNPAKDKFEGQLLHSSEHNKASDHQGKKVVVIGSCTSGPYILYSSRIC